QVNGRNAISWDDKFKLDVYYVDNKSFLLDIKILFLTVKKVFIKEGISQEGEATMQEFMG
ncbi:MAG: sugar transferase, partial [Cetobacterium sp.]